MADIFRAIQYEREYIYLRQQGEEPYSLLSKLQECGFSTLDDYFKAKIVEKVKELYFITEDTTSYLGAQKTIRLTEFGQAGFVFGNTTETCVFHGTEELNRQYCEDHNINIIDYNATGGNIIITAGDLSCGISVPVKDVDANWILLRIAEKIGRYTNNVTVDGNDILVNGKKVAGSASYLINDHLGFVIHFSFSDKTELINNICLPGTINKQIGYINFMSQADLRREIEQWQI